MLWLARCFSTYSLILALIFSISSLELTPRHAIVWMSNSTPVLFGYIFMRAEHSCRWFRPTVRARTQRNATGETWTEKQRDRETGRNLSPGTIALEASALPSSSSFMRSLNAFASCSIYGMTRGSDSLLSVLDELDVWDCVLHLAPFHGMLLPRSNCRLAFIQ